MQLTPRRVEGVLQLALALICAIALALAITYSVHGWATVLAPDMRTVNIVCGSLIAFLVISGLRKLR